MLILGIETSCDETAAAVVKNGREILSNTVASQINLHQKTGGVVPEVAAREHTVKIAPVIAKALNKAKITIHDIDAVAVTAGPGLLSSILIGVNSAMALALAFKKPLIPVQHVEGHIYANRLGREKKQTLRFPAVVLTVSGGHNELLLWKKHGEYRFLGATLDDAAGEAFDKVSRLLNLGYPGGPAIERAARRANKNAVSRWPLPRAWVTNWDFSFSGLKTAVLYLIKGKKITPQDAAGIAFSFQESVCEVLAIKLINAAKKYKTKEIHLAGGVSANSRLREWTLKLLPKGMVLRWPQKFSLCTDNAAMIAAAGFYKYKKNPRKYKKWALIKPDPNLEISTW